jgi:hypothetical protein
MREAVGFFGNTDNLVTTLRLRESEPHLPSPQSLSQNFAPALTTMSSSSGPVKVIIVGAGFAGLTAAIECHRKGHSVTVFEKIKDMKPLGDISVYLLSLRTCCPIMTDMTSFLRTEFISHVQKVARCCRSPYLHRPCPLQAHPTKTYTRNSSL